MSFSDYHLEERLMQIRVQEEHRQAELRDLQREARIANPRWLDRQRCWLLGQLGRRLVSLGTQLLEAGLPEPLPLGEQREPGLGAVVGGNLPWARESLRRSDSPLKGVKQMLRKRYVLAFTVLLALLGLGAFQLVATPISAATPGKEFVETVWAYEEAFRSGEVSQIIEFYAADAISLPPGYPPSEGRETIEADLTWFFDEFTLVERNFVLADYEVVGNYATRLGTWTQTLTENSSGASFTEVGRCILGWNKIEGEWKVVWEIWNTY